MARAENVVDITLMPAIPGTRMSSVSWLSPKIAPNRPRNSSGRKKLKNAADGLRQNIRRSRRYWCQTSAAVSATGGRLLLLGGQLEVDVLERRARDRQLAQRLATGQRGARELVQERRRVVGLARGQRAVL